MDLKKEYQEYFEKEMGKQHENIYTYIEGNMFLTINNGGKQNEVLITGYRRYYCSVENWRN